MYGVQDVSYDLMGVNRSQSELRKGEFWANQGISFELRRGECLGLIGKNGAGKTTLLKMLNGLIKPDQGSITMHGRVGALIALGAGFNPILTGRENVYIAASVLGFSKKEVDERFDEIVDFAEIPEFIDSPVQSYSSGMQVRLGFAVASSLEPDILLIDEVLAVGDVGFRTKCYNRIYELCKSAAVIFVSHNMPQIDRLCSRSMVLAGGKEVFCGPTGLAIDKYNSFFIERKTNVRESKKLILKDITVNNNKMSDIIYIENFSEFRIEAVCEFTEKINKVEISTYFQQASGEIIALTSNTKQNFVINPDLGINKFNIFIPKLFLGSGNKIVTFRIIDFETNEILLWIDSCINLSIKTPTFIPSPIYIEAVYS